MFKQVIYSSRLLQDGIVVYSLFLSNASLLQLYTNDTFKFVVHQKFLVYFSANSLRDKSNCSLVVGWIAILSDQIGSNYSILNQKFWRVFAVYYMITMAILCFVPVVTAEERSGHFFVYLFFVSSAKEMWK